jgi:CRISPR-associated endonuclease/helicase Cas3
MRGAYLRRRPLDNNSRGEQLSNSSRFYAHSTDKADRFDWQPLAEHLNAAALRAGGFARPFGSEALAHTAGLLHDLGKYTAEFQRRLEGGARVDHSTWGAKLACERYGRLGRLIAYAIAGHHAGLANGREPGERTALDERLNARLPDLSPVFERELNLPASAAELVPSEWRTSKTRPQFQLSLLARMIFSCVVDGDYLDTERFYGNPDALRARDTAKPSLIELRSRLDEYLDLLKKDNPIDATRADILAHARSRANEAPGMFSLTVPTGGGKTLTSLAFALDHAIANDLERVIFVIPFTSIVEQNAAVFRKAFGDLGEHAVVEHHSAFTEPQNMKRDSAAKLRVAMENWDAPVVVTTSVQFFESLYAARPSRCRKLHNIANSVVILDEAQALPLKLLRPCVAMLDELALNYRASIVLCTATQPALNAPKFVGGFADVRELAPEPQRLFDALARVTVEMAGALDDEQLVQRMRDRNQVLCIVNNKRHAQSLFKSIEHEPGARHLSTLMHARHRTRVLDDVRKLLITGEPCRLVSTSLIEAGVDVDFPHVLRAEAGLDSIAQAAGRCNREGKRARDESIVAVFTPANADWKPPKELEAFAAGTREVLREHGADPLSLAAVEMYFNQLYWQKGAQELDKPNLLGSIEDDGLAGFAFEGIERDFRMIDNADMPVIVADDEHSQKLVRDLRFATECGGIARKLQPYIVQVKPQVHARLAASGAIQPVSSERFGAQFMQLNQMDLYDERYGLRVDDDSGLRIESLIV